MSPQRPVPIEDISAVILAGGRARRMHGEDKGLIELHGRPLVDYILHALRPQAGEIVINANRNLERYRDFGCPVIEDLRGDFCGPLAGIASAMQASSKPWLLCVPCDSPFVPMQLTATLFRAMQEHPAEISVAHDGVRLQPVFALLDCRLLPDLLEHLDTGGRRVDAWYAQRRLAVANFSAMPEAFLNLNTPQDKTALEERISATP